MPAGGDFADQVELLIEKLLANAKKEGYQKGHKEGFRKGVQQAAELANEYNSSSTHSYMLGDCILGKLNMLEKKKPRKNKHKR